MLQVTLPSGPLVQRESTPAKPALQRLKQAKAENGEANNLLLHTDRTAVILLLFTAAPLAAVVAVTTFFIYRQKTKRLSSGTLNAPTHPNPGNQAGVAVRASAACRYHHRSCRFLNKTEAVLGQKAPWNSCLNDPSGEPERNDPEHFPTATCWVFLPLASTVALLGRRAVPPATAQLNSLIQAAPSQPEPPREPIRLAASPSPCHPSSPDAPSRLDRRVLWYRCRAAMPYWDAPQQLETTRPRTPEARRNDKSPATVHQLRYSDTPKPSARRSTTSPPPAPSSR